MPLNVEIVRQGETLKLRWGDFHLNAMLCAVSWDSGKGIFEDNSEPPTVSQVINGEELTGHWISNSHFFMVQYHHIAETPLNGEGYKLKHNYTFIDCQDGEVLELKAGDELKAWRSHK